MRAIIVLAAACVSVDAFTPVTRARAVRHAHARASPVVMMAEAEPEPSSSVLVAVSEDNVKTTVGIGGAVAGFSVAGPVGAAVGAAVANYASKKDGEVGDITMGLGKILLNVYNFALKTNDNFELTDKAGAALSEQLDKLKANSESDTIEQVEAALTTVTTKTGELYDEFAIGDKLKEVLTAAGGLTSDAIDKALDYAESEGLVDKAAAAVSAAKDQASAKIEAAKSSRA